MRAEGWWLCAALLLSGSSAFAAGFDGLDRLYFRRAAPTTLPREIRAHLPQVLRGDLIHGMKVEDEQTLATQLVSDYPLPRGSAGPDYVLRQVVRFSDSRRVEDLWWALYRDGQRIDLWRYRADPESTDMKLLANYRLEAVHMLEPGELVLHLRGNMERSGGLWFMNGLTLRCSVASSGLVLGRVLEAFWVGHGLDRGDTVNVLTARDTAGVVEELLADDVPLRRLAACGWGSVLIDRGETGYPAGDTPWSVVQAACKCVTSAPTAHRQVRRQDERSFCERGGKARDWQ